MQIMSVTDTQIHEMRSKGEAVAKELNDLLEKNNLKDPITAKKLGFAKDGYLAWANGGAALDLMYKFEKKDNTTKFHAGSFGYRR